MLPAATLAEIVGGGAPIGSQAWWDAVSRRGTPLRVPGEGETDLTVFLYRDVERAAVYVDVQPFTDRSRLADGLMDHVPGTDVWWAAFETGPEWVSAYSLVPLDEAPVAPAARNTAAARAWWLGILARARPDPLNPVAPFRGLREEARSLATGPRALRAPEPQDDDPRGTLERHAWDRPGVGPYPVWTYAPAGAADRAAGDLPLLVLHDGQVWAEQLDVAGLFDALVARADVPPFVAVLVSSLTQAERARDLPGSTAYYDALADDLLPGLTARLAGQGVAMTTDPDRTVVAGQSFGGLAAIQEVRHRPDRFGHALAQSASLWWPDLDAPAARAVAGWLRTAPPRTGRTVLQVGAHEGELTDANREARDLLHERGEHVVHVEVDGGHDWAWWRTHLGPGLVELLGRGSGHGAGPGRRD